jgi:hypothetical protein
MADKAKQRMGSENGRWQGGKSSDYRRRVTGAKDGELVHHKDHSKTNNGKSNFEVLKPKNGMTAIGVHNQKHPEKGRKK